MLEHLSEPVLVALIGLIGGVFLGLAARIGRFCTLGAIEDLYYGENSLRLAMWGIAVGTAVLSSYALAATEVLDLSQTLYLSRAWNPLSSIVGGLMFGYGMALAGNCGYGALARLGGGDLRSFLIVLVMGISAYVTLNGPLSGLRLWAFGGAEPVGQTPSYAHALAGMSGLPVAATGITIGALVLLGTLARRDLRANLSYVVWGGVVGLCITAGWAGTSWVAANGFAATPVVSHTFSAPLGETLIYTMTSSGNYVTFGTGSVFGVVLGALLGSMIKGHFRWEACDDPRELRRQILGAAIMGAGSVIAVGCSVGQGLSAMSVLSFGAPVTLACIMIGAAIGLRQLIWGFSPLV